MFGQLKSRLAAHGTMKQMPMKTHMDVHEIASEDESSVHEGTPSDHIQSQPPDRCSSIISASDTEDQEDGNTRPSYASTSVRDRGHESGTKNTVEEHGQKVRKYIEASQKRKENNATARKESLKQALADMVSHSRAYLGVDEVRDVIMHNIFIYST